MKKFVLLILIVCSFNVSAGLPVGITMGALLQEFEDSANRITLSASNAANNVVNNAAFNVINTVAQVRSEYEGALDKTSDELTVKQREIFEGLQSRIDQVFAGIDKGQDKLDNTLDNLAIFLSDSIFLSNEPRVSRFMSSMAVAKSIVETPLSILFKGKNLGHAKNSLHVETSDGHTLKPSTLADNEISFSLPRELINEISEPDRVKTIPIELSIHEPWFFFFTKQKSYLYKVRVIPNQLATAVVVSKEKKMVEVERKAKSVGGPIGSFRSGRTSRRNQSATMNGYPDSGWKIATDSLSTSWGGSDHCSGGSTQCTQGASPTVATYSCNVASQRGRGGKVTCSYALSMNFNQFREEETVSEKPSDLLAVNYDQAVSWPIPSNQIFDRIEATLFDGRKVIYEAEEENDLLKVSIDPASGTVLLTQNLTINELQ